MTEITFNVEPCAETGLLVASWDEPNQRGGITTQGKDLRELQDMVTEALACHFGAGKAPRSIRFHFLADPVLATKRSFVKPAFPSTSS
ncbi:MAG: 2-oxoisovalerate dehydrogenase [Limisphaerales bacterium]